MLQNVCREFFVTGAVQFLRACLCCLFLTTFAVSFPRVCATTCLSAALRARKQFGAWACSDGKSSGLSLQAQQWALIARALSRVWRITKTVVYENKKSGEWKLPARKIMRQRASLPHPIECSTLAVSGLSFRVRNGTGRLTWAMTTAKLDYTLKTIEWQHVAVWEPDMNANKNSLTNWSLSKTFSTH